MTTDKDSQEPLPEELRQLRERLGQLEEQEAQLRRRLETIADTGAQYRLIFESNPLPTWIYDLESLRFLAVNEAASQHHGYSREELLSMTLRDIRLPEDIPALLQTIERISSTSKFSGVWRHRTKAGNLIWVDVTSYPILFRGRRARLVIAQDVTERKEAEQALKQSEERYRDLVENSEDLMGTHDLDGRILSANLAVARRLGFDTPEQIVGRNFTDLLLRKHADRFSGYVDTVVRNGKAHGLTKVTTLSGQVRVWEYRNSLKTADGGKPVVRCIAHDVTEQTEAKAKLRKSEARNRAILTALSDVIFQMRRDGTVLKFTSVPSAEFSPRNVSAGESIRNVFPLTFAEECFIRAERALETGVAQIFECRLPSPGGMRDYEARLVGSGPNEVLGIIRRIREREARAADLLRMTKAINASSDAIAIADETGTYRYCNKSFTSLLECNLEELRAAGGAEVLFKDKRISRMVSNAVSKGYAWNGEVEVCTLQGSLRTVFHRADAVKDERGKIIGQIMVFTDITENKRSADTRESLIRKLENALTDVKALSGLLPICSYCKKIRDDKGYWNQLETYLKSHTEVTFSHGVCPDCVERLAPDDPTKAANEQQVRRYSKRQGS